MCTLPTHHRQLMLREYRPRTAPQVSLRRPGGKCQGRLSRCALKAANGALPSHGSCAPCPAPECMGTCMMTTFTLHIHRLGVLCATSLKPHSLTSLVAMCDSGDGYTEAYIHLTAHGKAAAEGATSSREGALDNGDQTHALSRAPSLARALGGFRCGSRVLPCKSQVSVHVWRASTTRMGHAILTASACSPGRGALGSVAPASLSRGACAPRP